MEETINLRVRTKLWTKIMRLPSFYYDEDSGDQLVSRVTSDAEAPSSLFSMAVSFVVCIVTSIQAFVQLYSYNTVLAPYSLIIIPLTLIVCVIYVKLTFRLGVFRHRDDGVQPVLHHVHSHHIRHEGRCGRGCGNAGRAAEDERVL